MQENVYEDWKILVVISEWSLDKYGKLFAYSLIETYIHDSRPSVNGIIQAN